MDIKIFTENIEWQALEQIYTLAKQPAFETCKIRIMPDVHAGEGCVIGFTANLGEKVIPGVVGVDIGCGMRTIELGKIDIDFEKLDKVIRKYVPSGRAIREDNIYSFKDLSLLRCFSKLKDINLIERNLGTLGGGNHFIEIDSDSEGNKYLVIHTGSRSLGKQVAEYYQNLAIDNIRRNSENRTGKGIPKDLCYLEGSDRDDYLHDMQICQKFAIENRTTIAESIIDNMGWKIVNEFETVHNYIELKTNIVRKGAISAKKGERVLIPINMRDGCIIGIGKGNEDWNESAPHGAGRLMSRSKAKESISLEDFAKAMEGIYTTSVSQSTIDESPMAYKSMEEILEKVGDTIEVEKIIKPVYNFKA